MAVYMGGGSTDWLTKVKVARLCIILISPEQQTFLKRIFNSVRSPGLHGPRGNHITRKLCRCLWPPHTRSMVQVQPIPPVKRCQGDPRNRVLGCSTLYLRTIDVQEEVSQKWEWVWVSMDTSFSQQIFPVTSSIYVAVWFLLFNPFDFFFVTCTVDCF